MATNEDIKSLSGDIPAKPLEIKETGVQTAEVSTLVVSSEITIGPLGLMPLACGQSPYGQIIDGGRGER